MGLVRIFRVFDGQGLDFDKVLDGWGVYFCMVSDSLASCRCYFSGTGLERLLLSVLGLTAPQLAGKSRDCSTQPSSPRSSRFESIPQLGGKSRVI